jgi:hypothetical protein
MNRCHSVGYFVHEKKKMQKMGQGIKEPNTLQTTEL